MPKIAPSLVPLLLCPCLASCQPAAKEQPPVPQDQFVIVKSRKKPDQPWMEYKTRTLEGLAGFVRPTRRIELSKYGGRMDRREEARGFTYVKQIGDRWWLVDPEGYLLLHVGVVSVNVGKSKAVQEAFQKLYGGQDKWAEATVGLLRDNGFNGVGAWSAWEALRRAPRPVLYTCIWNFMSSFGKSKKLTFQQPGHTGYPSDCIPVFHPEFEAFCEQHAKQLEAVKDDPWCVGHFSDNEMPAPSDLLDKSLKLDANNPDLAPGLKAAQEWLRQRKGKDCTLADVTDPDRWAFRGYVFERYFEVVSKAIRKVDPNHLYLGPRLYGSSLSSQSIFRAAGKYLDAIAINYYGVWTPNPETMSNWLAWSGRPIIITEWYTKGDDVGYKNTTGAGWIVPTQEDRGKFYQNYALALLESRVCVGWHWFKYMDNDPEDLTTDPSNRDSNKGIVSIRFEPYAPLLARMKALNENVYAVVDHLDQRVSAER